VHEVLTGRANLGLTPSIPAPGTLEEHLRTAHAIVAADAEAAERHSRTHLRTVWGEIRATDRPGAGD
jgi:DNA-binding GntR family transcriptional regulator